MNDLNEKMLKFAGFKIADIKKHYYWEIGGFRVAKWIAPNTDYHTKPPNFPNDLNACFERLEPELYRRGLRYQLTRLQDGHIAEIFKPSKTWAKGVASAFDEKPATAFCKAVEQLLEKP